MIFVTGSSGFIGKNFISLSRPDIIPISRTIDTEFKYNLVKSNLSNIDLCQNTKHALIHLGGLAHGNYDNQAYDKVVDSTIDLAKQAVEIGIKRFVFVSSIIVNGSETKNEKFSSLSEEKPQNYYAKSKHRTEIELKNLACDTGLELVIVRPTLVYGPDAPLNFGSLVNLISNFPFLPFGLTSNRRDFISVQNLVDLLLICATHSDAPGNIFLASDNETVSIRRFTNSIAKGLGKRLYQLPIPTFFIRIVARLFGKLSMAEQLLSNLEVDSSNIKHVLGWTPPYSMEESMHFLKRNK